MYYDIMYKTLTCKEHVYNNKVGGQCFIQTFWQGGGKVEFWECEGGRRELPSCAERNPKGALRIQGGQMPPAPPK